jgi:hypothetical protein
MVKARAEVVEDLVEVVAEAPPPLPKAASRTRACPECGEAITPTASRCRFCKAELEPEEDEAPARKRTKYEPCPKCEATGAKRVPFTLWGSFYFTKLFCHVRCPDCGYCYNGHTGGSNLLPAFICVTIPLLCIAGIVGFILWILHDRGHL